MTLHRTAIVHTSISSPPQQLIAYLSDLNNWRSWAPWVHSVNRSSDRDWTVETDVGQMHMRFVETNSLGVLDHDVTLSSGLTVHNSMRVLRNGSGSELVMVLFQSPGVSNDVFARDIQAVTDDLARLKGVAETLTEKGGQ
ncbi:MAG TPA: SRPBCC family protein [Gemmatimonadaceae bacterium]|jgi:carbon monoxide dehydrogenase subunit G|nr:SRPBCC family protein [Gemmatimonadaceae bacterium]